MAGPYRLVLENDCRLVIYDRDNEVAWRNWYFSFGDDKEEEHVDGEDPAKEVEHYEKSKLFRTTTLLPTTTSRKFSPFDLDEDEVEDINEYQ